MCVQSCAPWLRALPAAAAAWSPREAQVLTKLTHFQEPPPASSMGFPSGGEPRLIKPALNINIHFYSTL